jgi:hypothetical protein
MERSTQPMNKRSSPAEHCEPRKQERQLTSADPNEAQPTNDEEEQVPKGASKRDRKNSLDDIDDDLVAPEASRRKRLTHFGDDDFAMEDVRTSIAARLLLVDKDPVTWSEIRQSCCFHTQSEWINITGGVFVLLVCLYFVLFGLQLMGSASKVMAGCASGELFGNDVSRVNQYAEHLHSTSRKSHTFPPSFRKHHSPIR